MSSETEQLTMTDEVTTDSIAKQPLLIETVMECLFSHLDFPSLKVARLVCKAWKETGTGHILERGAVVFSNRAVDPEGVVWTLGYGDCDGDPVDVELPDIDNLTKRMKALRLLDKMSSPIALGLEEDARFKNYVWVNAPPWKIPNPIQDYFTNFGHHVKSLKFQRPRFCRAYPFHPDPESRITLLSYFTLEFLVKILEACPNLEELEAFCLRKDFDDLNQMDLGPLFQLDQLAKTQELKLKTLTLLIDTGIHYTLLEHFFKAFRKLEAFTVTYRYEQGNDIEIVKNLFGLGEVGKINLSSLRRFDMAWESIVTTTRALQAMTRQPLPNLSFLRITIPNRVDEVAFNGMLEHLSGSLRHLRLTNVSRDAVLEFAPRFPTSMLKLETLELAVGCNQLLMGAVEDAVNLPHLKRLILHREAIHETRGYVNPGAQYDFTECWASLPPNWAANRQKGLQTLELPCGLTQAEHLLQFLAVFPNVRDLRLQNPSDEVIGAVFAEGTHLERLSIRMVAFPKKIDSLLTGLRPKICSHMVKVGKYFLKDPNQVKDWGPGLRDMKNLQYFELRQWNQSNWLTEASLWQGLMYLTHAYHLDLGLGPSHRLSDPSIAALKSALGSRCVINIDTRTRDPPTDPTPDTRLCYWEFWPRDMTKSGKWKACVGTCCQILK